MWDVCSQTRDRTHVRSGARWIFNHWAHQGGPKEASILLPHLVVLQTPGPLQQTGVESEALEFVFYPWGSEKAGGGGWGREMD